MTENDGENADDSSADWLENKETKEALNKYL